LHELSSSDSVKRQLEQLLQQRVFRIDTTGDRILERDPLSEGALQSIGEMLTSPWFSHLWIFQEAANAQRTQLLYGSYWTELVALPDAINHSSENHLVQPCLFDAKLDFAVINWEAYTTSER
jgi:hypothetical protein